MKDFIGLILLFNSYFLEESKPHFYVLHKRYLSFKRNLSIMQYRKKLNLNIEIILINNMKYLNYSIKYLIF